ncbi:twin-arginine translocation signal domain-containing protein [Sphingomonas sp.]|uniref:twin-arginine translocation signal domain-containing protein n=1 Tax=Sphingomonas sp. TaxID=28214 RepID=UPI0025F8E76E|nr:twin-arginine translocation signal domain-containing protein [Sphingomonas sp.]MBV9528488.1 twin-arginine translocation signal domain-containing protein [Sphingomonas sp.]
MPEFRRRDFLKTSALGVAAAGAGLAAPSGAQQVLEHNWSNYDWGSGPPVPDRLNQGPFSNYGADANAPGGEVVMATSPSRDIVPNYGMGLTVYVSGDIGPPRLPGQTLEQSIEDLIKLPFVQKVYLRPNWREVQRRPGRLDFPDWWTVTFDLARKYGKRVGFRVMLENPDFPEPGMPDFLMAKVPYVTLKGSWPGDPSQVRYRKKHAMPRYDDPAYQAAFDELNALLADRYNGSPDVEYMDTMMYGFWGEGHSWPYEGNPFSNNAVAQATMLRMLETQLRAWTRTPLATNTQPDFSNVGNAAVLDRTVRSGNWIRSDTIFIENTQIEALSNRPPWVAAISEVPMTRGDLDKLGMVDGVTMNEQVIAHVLGVGANYFSIWNWHDISADHVLSYYDKYPQVIDHAARRIGYRIYPAFVWPFERDGGGGMVVGLANDGVASPPGVVRLTLSEPNGTVVASGSLDPGYPRPTGIRQAMLSWPARRDWAGLRLRAELEVKGVRHLLRWACAQRLESDGSLTLRRNLPST